MNIIESPIFSDEIKRKFNEYKIIKDKNGMSPAEVYKLINEENTYFLKRTDTKFQDTTYDIKRECNIIKWLSKKINIPEIIHYEEDDYFNTMVMTEVTGNCLDHEKSDYLPEETIDIYAKSIRILQSINIENCPYDNSINNRLKELEYLLSNNLADIDCDNWEEDTNFENPDDLFKYLVEKKPNENFVFSHGDLCNSNIFIENDEIKFIDLGRAGIADKWNDIAFCIKEIKEMGNDEKHIELFFNKLGIEPDWEKIKYYILLDEMF